jgi:hemerythrin-like domain-containing protein
LRELTASLVADHRELEHHWSRLRRQLALVAAGQATRLTDDVVADFVSLYERHIAREESELLPMAQRLLSEEELDRIGLAMRVRRNAVEPPDTAAPA